MIATRCSFIIEKQSAKCKGSFEQKLSGNWIVQEAEWKNNRTCDRIHLTKKMLPKKRQHFISVVLMHQLLGIALQLCL